MPTIRSRTSTTQAGDLGRPYDLILLAVKAYSLDAAMDDITPAVGAERTAHARKG